MKKKMKAFELILISILLVYFFIAFIIPGIFFKSKTETNNLIIYHNFNDSDVEAYIENHLDNLVFNEIDIKKAKPKLYFCNNTKLYTFLNPLNRKSKATTFSFFNYSLIIFSNVNLKNNSVTSIEKEFSTRNLSSTIIHELCHFNLSKGFPLLNSLFYSKWNEEGVCEYFANDSSYDIDKGIYNFINKTDDPHISYKYFKYRLIITYLIEIENNSIESALKYKIDSSLIDKIINYLVINGNNSIIKDV